MEKKENDLRSKKNSFVLHKDSLVILDGMDDCQAGRFFKLIYGWQKNREIEIPDEFKMVFTLFANQFLRDDEKYEKTKIRNKSNISKHWENVK